MAAEDEAVFASQRGFDDLPAAELRGVLAKLPARCRARASCVCRAWRKALDEASVWAHLDLSPAGGVARDLVTAELLRGAAARARGALASLDVAGCDALPQEALQAVLAANAGSLRTLRLGLTDAKALAALARAAPGLTALHAGVRCAGAEARKILRRAPPYGAVQLVALCAEIRPFIDPDAQHTVADVAAHGGVASLTLAGADLRGAAACDTVADTAAAARLRELHLDECGCEGAVAVPALARLLRAPGGALASLRLRLGAPDAPPRSQPLLDAPLAALLADAIRSTECGLQRLELDGVGLWREPAVGAALLTPLAGHPRLRALLLTRNAVAAEHAAAVGATLAALLAPADGALCELDVAHCGLGDAGLRPLCAALVAGARLRALGCGGNATSDAFARDALLPAVRANTALRALRTADSVGAVAAATFVEARERQREADEASTEADATFVDQMARSSVTQRDVTQRLSGGTSQRLAATSRRLSVTPARLSLNATM
jgi:hypothetical protein